MEQKNFVDTILTAWNRYLEQLGDLFNNLPDNGDLENSFNKNRLLYTIGHLTALNDETGVELGLRELLYPELVNDFLVETYRTSNSGQSIHNLLAYWRNVNCTLTSYISDMQLSDWFEDKAGLLNNELQGTPQGSKLNVILTKTHHLVYHLGQLALLTATRKQLGEDTAINNIDSLNRHGALR